MTDAADSAVAGLEPDYRFTLANERTFLAWQRTSLALLATAVAVIEFLPQHTDSITRYGLGAMFGTLAAVTAGGGLHRWHAGDHAIRAGLPLPAARSMPVLAVVLLVSGLITVTVALVLAATR